MTILRPRAQLLRIEPLPGLRLPAAPPRARRRSVDADELADYLQLLEEEIARVRRDLDELRGYGRPER